jgi:tRNA threonylcarbamoyladenosine biosynthesis protein TsaB
LAIILNIETATTVCSVAISKDDQLISFREHQGDYKHAELLAVFIKDCIEEANLIPSDINAVAVSKGPGSYTGLRIGVSAAKGFCYAMDVPLIAIGTLQQMAYGVSAITEFSRGDLLFCPMIDARRMEIYCAIYDASNKTIQDVSAVIVDDHFLLEKLNKHKIAFFGDALEKCSEVLSKNPNAILVHNILPSAKSMLPLSFESFRNEKFENVAYFEPFYLKEFISTVPKKQV